MTTLPRKPTKAVLAHLDALQQAFHNAAWTYARAIGAYCQEPVHHQELYQRCGDASIAWGKARLDYLTACAKAGVDPKPWSVD
jgi:hypothetical protein